MQDRFKYRHGRRAQSLLIHKKFRAGYDFLLLRANAGEIPMVVEDVEIGETMRYLLDVFMPEATAKGDGPGL